MKKKSLLLTAVATLGLTAATMAQNVPNYVPTNGLVGWWPFNGNANDESGNGNNGTINGATLTSDRLDNVNKAYSFQGANDQIEINTTSGLFDTYYFTISFWLQTNQTGGDPALISRTNQSGNIYDNFVVFESAGKLALNGTCVWTSGYQTTAQNTILGNIWKHVIVISTPNTATIFINGVLAKTDTTANSYYMNFANYPIRFGKSNHPYWGDYSGNLDDIGIWNRALTQQEITDLYNAANCANNTTITPSTNILNTGSTATFVASTSDPNPSYVWQSDLGQGFQTLNNFGNYSGTNTATLNVSNVQLSEHNQPIRVITTSGNCIDTSNVAIISIADTCINTITDTTLITVTDTLLINTNLTGVNPPNNINTIKIFPNPANDHITINYGNFSVMNGYQLKIENSLGQQVFQTNITQQSDYVNLSTWGGNGMYFVHLVNPQGNIIDIRKIVLQ